MVQDPYGAMRATLFVALGLTVGPGCGPNSPGEPNTTVCAGGSSTTIPGPNGSPSGYESCADETVHKVGPANCDSALTVTACQGTEQDQQCTSDAECTSGPNGQCGSRSIYYGGGEPEVTTCACVYTCATDGDCGTGQVCMCAGLSSPFVGPGYSVCVPAGCATDSDCPTGECSLSEWTDGCQTGLQTACRTSDDECRTHNDCGSNGSWCALESPTAQQWSCISDGCAIGRLLVVDGQVWTATGTQREDWSIQLTVSPEDLPLALRLEIARRWEIIAALEHASIASFARTTLSLLALGAPPDLLIDTQRAAADEVEHARITYSLVGRYGGVSRGPGPLPLPQAQLSLPSTRREAIKAVIAEACVGETLGAAEARSMALNTRDSELALMLEQIAMDEERHAALAWRTLQWLMGDDSDLREVARFCLQDRIEALMAAPVEGIEIHGHGLLSAQMTRRVREETLLRVVRPVVAGLLGADIPSA